MKKAFVFGKFYPFHLGHKSMIEFALTQSDFLYVLVCASDKEKIKGDIRAQWISKTFENQPNIKIIYLDYQEDLLPNTSISSREVSYIWAKKFQEILPNDVSLLITSEDYGDFLAEYMQITHILYDRKREKNAISATEIRANLWKKWHFLPLAVKPFFAKKIVILGTESTGKTTLTQQLAAYFQVPYVLEVGREIIPNSQSFTPCDLQKVVKAQSLAIQKASASLAPFIIIDTDLHITQSYSLFCFQQKMHIDAIDAQQQKADLYIYLNKEVPFVQDGTRLLEENRNLLDISHRKVLAEKGVDFVEVSGSWEEREEKCVALIRELLRF